MFNLGWGTIKEKGNLKYWWLLNYLRTNISCSN